MVARAFELAKFLHVSTRTGMSKNVRDAFLSGYQAVQALTEHETSSLQTFTQVAHIWQWSISLTAAKLHEYSKLDNSYFTHRLGQLKLLNSPEWQLF